MAEPADSLKWSTQLQVAPQSRTPRLNGDKITLPPSALEALLAAAPVVSVQTGASRHNMTSAFDPFNPLTYAAERHARAQVSDQQQQLPHPLTFKIVNPRNGRAVYAGIREFSAEQNEVGLSSFLQGALGLRDGSSPQKSTRSNTPSGDMEMDSEADENIQNVTIHAKQLPKGTYVRLRPLEAGYDPEDWKSLLERYLRDNFTTLTNGELLDVPGARHEHFRFLVDKVEPEGDGICIVDTDLEVDIEALNEEQARETLTKRLAKNKRAPGTAQGSSTGGEIKLNQEVAGQVVPGEYVDYELKNWSRHEFLDIRVETADEDGNVDVLASPFSASQRSHPRLDDHMFSDLSERPSKRLRLSPTNVNMEGAQSVYITLHAWKNPSPASDDPTGPIPYTLNVTSTSNLKTGQASQDETSLPGTDEVTCKNCHQNIPKRTLPLHEAFCYRNNVLCPHCNNVFLKSSPAWKNHWHCPHDSAYGNTSASQAKHNSVFHPPSPLDCPGCDFIAFNLPILAQHRTTVCPAKEILCQFCHLIVPQKGPEDPEFNDPSVLLSGLTPHELADGARTTDCHICHKIVRLRDMKTHLALHDRDRLVRPTPRLCVNPLCGSTIKSADEFRVAKEQLGLCSDCFGPLYVANYDPEGKALRRRVERRLLQQLIGGCGKHWCRNETWCKTAKHNSGTDGTSLTAKEALPLIRPTLEQLTAGASNPNSDAVPLFFCVDEIRQGRRIMAEFLAAEGEYTVQWCVRALEESKRSSSSSSEGSLGRAREWLSEMAPKIGEVLGGGGSR